MGTCTLIDLAAEAVHDDFDDLGSETEQTGDIELLEAGELQIRTRTGAWSLVPQHFPGLLPFISGVGYNEVQTAQPDELGPLDIQATGGDAVGQFHIVARIPPIPRVDQNRLPPVVQRGDALELSWSTAREPSENTSANELAMGTSYVELRNASDRNRLLRCVPKRDPADDNVHHAHISAWELWTLFPGVTNQLDSSADEKRLLVDMISVQQTSFEADGIDTGELRINAQKHLEIDYLY